MSSFLPIGAVLTNEQICKTFKCSNIGGMRPSPKTKTLVLILDYTKNLYNDRWENGILYYTGMGRKGDQKLKAGNKTLAESKENGYTVHLFEVSERTRYEYKGEVELAEDYHFEDQNDINGNVRKVIIFPLRLKDLNEEDIREIEDYNDEKEKELKEISTGELEKRILKGRYKRAEDSRTYYYTRTKMYHRDSRVKEYAERRAKGKCELCGKDAPFKDSNGYPYLECHHIIWLSKHGEDTIENTVALCPDCHRRMHILQLKEDIEKLQKLEKYIKEDFEENGK